MQEKKKRNRILMLLIVGMLLIYAFTDIENVKISRGRNIFLGLVSQNVLKQAANWLLPGLTYVKEGRKDTLTGRIEKRTGNNRGRYIDTNYDSGKSGK